MSYLRTQHIFVVLMAFSAITGFIVPPQYVGRFQPQVQRLFAPIAWPARKIAGAIQSRVAPAAVEDRRGVADISTENRQLRSEVAMLHTQLEEMYRRDAQLQKLGELKDLCKLFKVIGGDSGTRDSLAIAASTLEGVKDEQYVLYPGGLVGQIQRSGYGGAQIRLITDAGFRVRVRFVRFTKAQGETNYEPVGTPVVLAQGAGNGTMLVRDLPLSLIGYDTTGKPKAQEQTLHEGDSAILFDPDCPRALQGRTLGHVIRISASADARQMAEVRLQPDTNLNRLREVMVMTKEN
jgi:cell shape-determining protein MreC